MQQALNTLLTYYHLIELIWRCLQNKCLYKSSRHIIIHVEVCPLDEGNFNIHCPLALFSVSLAAKCYTLFASFLTVYHLTIFTKNKVPAPSEHGANKRCE